MNNINYNNISLNNCHLDNNLPKADREFAMLMQSKIEFVDSIISCKEFRELFIRKLSKILLTPQCDFAVNTYKKKEETSKILQQIIVMLENPDEYTAKKICESPLKMKALQNFLKTLNENSENLSLNAKKNLELLNEEYNSYIKIRNSIVENYKPLVFYIVKKFSKFQSDHKPLISVGFIGLINAVESYNSTLGTFTTYACNKINYSILSYYFKVALSSEEKESLKLTKFLRKINLLEEQSKKFPENEEIKKNLDLYNERLRKLTRRYCYKDNVDKYGNVLDEKSIPPINAAIESEEKEMLKKFFSMVKGNDILVIKILFGFHPQFPNGSTLKECGKFLGITREYVRQLKEKGLKKIRFFLEYNSDLSDPNGNFIKMPIDIKHINIVDLFEKIGERDAIILLTACGFHSNFPKKIPIKDCAKLFKKIPQMYLRQIQDNNATDINFLKECDKYTLTLENITDIKKCLENILKSYPPLRRSIAIFHYGLLSSQPHSIEQCGKIFGLERENLEREFLFIRRNFLQSFKEQFSIFDIYNLSRKINESKPLTAEKENLLKNFYTILPSLNNIESNFLYFRFNIELDKTKSVKQCSEHFGISCRSIVKLERSILNKLKQTDAGKELLKYFKKISLENLNKSDSIKNQITNLLFMFPSLQSDILLQLLSNQRFPNEKIIKILNLEESTFVENVQDIMNKLIKIFPSEISKLNQYLKI